MLQKKVAFVVTILLTAILLSPVFGQGPEQPVGVVQGNIGAFKPATPPEITPAIAPVKAPVQSVDPQGLQGEPGTPGRDGKDGRNGRNGRDGKTIIRTRVVTTVYRDQRGHLHVWKHLQTWDPASCSFVEARDAQTLREAKAYTDRRLRGAQPQTTNQHHGWQWLWWLLLFFLLVWAILVGLWYLGGSLWRYLRRPPATVAGPEPDVTNTDSGDYYGYDKQPATVALHCDGTTVIKKWKGYADVSNGDGSFKWAATDETIEGKFKVGAKIAFALCRENTGNVPIPTEGVTIKDDFHVRSFGQFIPGSGRLVVSGKKVADLDDEFIRRIIGGARVALDEVIDEIPSKSSVSIVYFVRCVPTAGHGPGPADEAKPEEDNAKEVKQGPRLKLADIEAEWKTEAKAKQEAEEAARKAEADRQAAEKAAADAAKAKAKAEAEQATNKTTEKSVGTAKREVRVEAEKTEAKPETKAEIVDRVRKEVLRRDNPVPNDFQSFLMGLENEAAIRTKMNDYYHARGKLLSAAKAQNPDRPNYTKTSDLSAKVAMGQLKVEDAEKEFSAPVTSTTTETGNAEDAKDAFNAAAGGA